jgi:hypothetical protein
VPIETIHRITYWFDRAFQGLMVDVPPAEVQELVMLVHQCMEGKTRTYHTAFHVLGLCEGLQPIQVLAALFHDVVFYQLDGGFPVSVSALLKDVTRPESGSLRLLEIASDDQALALCADIFDFRPDEIMSPNRGMNEFLSAVVAVRLLHQRLSSAQLIAVVACIELTIPFRAPDAKGNTPAEVLAQRVQARCAVLFDSATQRADFVKTTLTEAVIFANRDIAGFIEAPPEHCLSNSMLLIEESMMPQAASGASSLLTYRGALLGMDNFLSQLNPAHVGQSFAGHPDASGVIQMQATTQKNIAFVRDYLAAVLSSVAIIEALARSTGTDYPMTMFLSSMNAAEADFFPVPTAGALVSAELLHLLDNGLAPEENPGLNALPLTACVYRFLGQEAAQHTLRQAKQMFDGDLAPRAFLRNLNRDMVCAIIRKAAKTNAAHKEALLALERSLYASNSPI